MRVYLYIQDDWRHPGEHARYAVVGEMEIPYIEELIKKDDWPIVRPPITRCTAEIDELDYRTMRRFNKIRTVDRGNRKWDLYMYRDIKHYFDLEEEDD